jgi:uncharacterized membrane protein
MKLIKKTVLAIAVVFLSILAIVIMLNTVIYIFNYGLCSIIDILHMIGMLEQLSVDENSRVTSTELGYSLFSSGIFACIIFPVLIKFIGIIKS